VRETLDLYCELHPVQDISAVIAKIEGSLYQDLFF
jgi:hypothetical protein